MASATTYAHRTNSPAAAGVRVFVGMGGAAATLIADQPRGH